MIKKRSIKKTISAILGGLFMVVLSGISNTAHAQIPPQATQTQIQNCQQQWVNNELAAVHKKTAAAQGVWAQMAQIDAAAYHCLDQLEALMDNLDNIIPSDGGNPLVSIAIAAVKSMALNLVLQVLSAECQSLMQTIRQLETFALSQFNRLCIPLPKISLNLGIGGLHLKLPQCHGVNLFGPMLGINTPNSSPATWNLWNVHTR